MYAASESNLTPVQCSHANILSKEPYAYPGNYWKRPQRRQSHNITAVMEIQERHNTIDTISH